MTIRATRPFFIQGLPPVEAGDELPNHDAAAHAVALGFAADDTEPPTQSATVADWRTFRAVQGHDVEGLTKQALIDLDGGAVDEHQEVSDA